MASSIFPTSESGIFVPSLWQLPSGKFTREYADLHYLQFPLGQGTETIPNLNITGTTNLGATNISNSSLIITDGTTTNTIDKTGYTTKNSVQNLTHYLNFSDSSTTGIGPIQKSANFSVNPSTGTLTASGLVTATGGLTTGSGSVLTSTGTTTLTGATTATGLVTANGGITTGSSSSLTLRNTQPITGMVCGSGTGGTSTGTVSFGYTFSTAPMVVATMNSSATTSMYVVQVGPITTTGFNYSKVYYNGVSIGGATSEVFTWIAIGK